MDSTTAYHVYLVTCAHTAKQYVGITNRGIRRRWQEHLYSAKHTSMLPLHAAIRKYGADSFQVELLDSCATGDELLAREQHWIATLGTIAPNGYNITTGGKGHYGVALTPEHRRKIADANRANAATRCDAAMRERMRQVALTRGPEHLAKISASLTGKHHTLATVEKLRVARARQVFTPEDNEKRAAKNRGRIHTARARANMSRAQLGRTVSADHRRNLSQSLSALSDAQAAVIRFDALHIRKKDYAAMFGIAPQTITGITHGRTYRHVTREHLPADPSSVVPHANTSRANSTP